MNERDLLVAAVATGLGVMMMHTAILSDGWCFKMALARAISRRRGHQAARIAIGAIGTFMILLGVYTACASHLTPSYSRDVEPTLALPDSG